MASKGRIDSIVDIPKIQDEIKFLTGSLERVLDQIESIAEAGAKLKFEGFGQAKSIKETAAATTEMEKALKDIESLTAQLNKISNERLELEKKLISIEKERVSVSQGNAKVTQDEASWSLKKVSAVFEEVKLTKELKDVINSVLGTKQENIKRLAEEQARLKEVNSSMRDNAKAFENGAKNGKEYLATQQRLIDEQSTLKVAISELTARIKQEEKIEQAATGTAKEKSLILDKLREAYKNLSEEQKNNSSIGGQLQKEISKMDAGLKEYDATIGNHQRNVGDYEIAGRSMRTELMLMTEQLARMKQEGLEDSDVFKELSLRAGEMRDAFDDARAEVKKLASDTGGLDQLISVAEGLAGAYTAIEGASALLGVKNEELQQTFVKLQAAMAVLNGLRSIQNVLQKESAAYTLAENLQKKLSVLLTYAQNKAETGGILTRKLATAAQWALNKAMLANPAGLLLAALAALVAIGYVLFKVFTSNAEIQKTYASAIRSTQKAVVNLNRELERNIKVMEATGSTQQDIIKEKIRAAEDEYKRQSVLIRMLIAEYKNLTDEQKEQLKELQKSQEENNKRIADLNDDLYINSLKQQKQTQKLKLENMKEGLNRELSLLKFEADQQIREAGNNAELAMQIKSNQLKREHEIRKKYAHDYLKTEKETISKLNESRIGIMQDGFEKELADLRFQYQQRISDLEMQLKTEEHLTQEQRSRIKETILNTQKELAKEEEKLIIESSITANQKHIELINTRLDTVRKGSSDELELKLKSIDLQRLIELAEAEKTGLDKQAIIDKYNKLAADESYNFLIAQLDVESRTRILSLDRLRQIELRSLRDQLEQKLITSEEYAQKIEEVESKYNIKKAENALKLAQQELDKIKELGGDTLAAEEKLTAAQMALDDTKTANFIRNREKEKEAQQQLNERLTELGQELFNTAQAVSDATFSNRIQNIDSEAKKDEDEKAKELQRAGNNKALIEQINAKYDAREKQRDAQRRKIEVEQAKFAKTAAIFQIAINTAQAISKIWAEVPKVDFGVSTIALTAVAAGIGLAQAAAIASQPLPKYWRGRESGPAEWAIVGEKGQEAIQYPSGETFLTPGKPTITFLPAKAKVIPNHELTELAEMTAFQNLSAAPVPISSYDFRRLEKEVSGLYSGFSMLADTVRNKKEFHINITEKGMYKLVKNGHSFQEYLNSKVRI
jgi:hypothetical protein